MIRAEKFVIFDFEYQVRWYLIENRVLVLLCKSSVKVKFMILIVNKGVWGVKIKTKYSFEY